MWAKVKTKLHLIFSNIVNVLLMLAALVFWYLGYNLLMLAALVGVGVYTIPVLVGW